MLQSMTGFASKAIILEAEQNNKTKLSISIKSLNSRFFDVTCKVPYIFNQFETEFIKLLKSKLFRGHVYFNIHSSNQSIFKTSIEPSTAAIAGYINAANQIKDQFNIPGQISINDIIRLPDVFILEEKGIDENSKKLIFQTIEELLNDLIIERQKEGSALREDLLQRISIMQQKLEQINALFEVMIGEQKEKISKKIHEINENFTDTFAETQRQVMYLTLDKMDIHEELVRFKNHLHSLITLIQAPTLEKGKQIDFTLQELGREINTISAKTNHALIIECAIAIKVELEKAREQNQNIV